jgi:hypothetical protein
MPSKYVLHEAGAVGNQVPIFAEGSGLTIREHAAITLCAGILANPSATVSPGNAHLLAITLADNLLHQLAKESAS